MPALKLDLIFECKGRGWEETYYADFGITNFDQIHPFAEALANKRIVLAAPPVELKAYRVSDPLTKGRQGRASYYKPVRVAPTNPAWTGAVEPSAAVNVGFLKTSTNQTRRIQMRGCPDDIMVNFGTLSGGAYDTWRQLWEQWRLVMLGTPRYGWLSRPTIGDPAPVSYSLANNPILPEFTTVADFFPADDVTRQRYVRLRGFNGNRSELNRELIVYVSARNKFVPVAPIAAGPMITPGLVQRYGPPEFVAADQVEVEKAGRRAPGAPLLQTPGRSRARPRT